MIFESDYPHQDGTWPYTREQAAVQFGHLDQAVIDKIARGTPCACSAWRAAAGIPQGDDTTGVGSPRHTPVSLCWGTTMRATLPDLVEVAAPSAFDAVSITPAMYADALAAGLSVGDIRRRCADAGVEVSLIDPLMSALPGPPTPVTPAGGSARSSATARTTCYRIAEALDVGAVNVAHYMAAEVPVASLIDSLGPLCERAGHTGSGCCWSSCPKDLFPTWPRRWRSCGRPVRRTSRSCSTPGTSSGPAGRWTIWRTGPRRSGRAAGQPCPGGTTGGDRGQGATAASFPGEGAIPVGALIDRVLTPDPDAFIGIEVFSDDLNRLPLGEAAARARASMREAMA